MVLTSTAVEQSGRWDEEAIVSDPEQYYQSLIADITAAKTSIELAVYIFTLDSVGERVLSALIAASARGVAVRVIVDGVGSADDAGLLARQLSAGGVDIRIYHPLPWYLTNYPWSLTTGGFVEKCYHFLTNINRRDHRKFCVIDRAVAWCGSFNICADHVGKTQPWRDYCARVSGARVVDLTEHFDSVWFLRQPNLVVSSFHFFRGNNSLRLRWFSNRLLVRRILRAKARVWICSAYFSPMGSVYRAIKIARRRGVDVRLIVAGKSDVPFFPLLSSTYYADLLKLGVSIYCYQEGILHAKVLLIDQLCVVGSTNLNHRSFYHDLELDVVLSQASTINEIGQLLEQDMSHSQLASLDQVSRLSRTFWFGWMMRMLRYWM